MKKLYIYGVGGLGREIHELLKTINVIHPKWSITGFIDDDKIGYAGEGIPVLSGADFLGELKEPVDVVLGIANTRIKEKLYKELKNNELISFPAVVHPSVIISGSSIISEGAVIFYSCFISVNTYVGTTSLMSAGSQLAHDSKLGDFCSVMPSVNISGNVKIGERVFIGVQSSIRQGICIGKDSVIGMGSVVVKDVPENCTVVGNPAKEIRIKILITRREIVMGKFRCLECGLEFELDTNEKTKNCPECRSRYLEYLVGEPLKRGKSWSAKTFSVK